MKEKFRNLSEFRNDAYSQNGEDGILDEILKRLDQERNQWCVEFGAWDGKHLSNTFYRVENFGFNAIYIEGDPQKYEALLATAKSLPSIVPILQMVGSDDKSGLDHILAQTEVPTKYALLSIDIDSWDLDIWVRHVAYRPAVVVIEVNSNIPPGILQWNPGPGNFSQGSSFSATLQVGRSKDYTLVAHTGNCIFVANEMIDELHLPKINLDFPERLFDWSYIKPESKQRWSKVIKRGLSRFK